MEIVLKDGIEYLKFAGGMTAQLLGGKQWLKIDLNQVSAVTTGVGLGPALGVNQSTDPALQKVSGDSSVGASRIDEHLSDWGAPVNITAPPTDQVTHVLTLTSGETRSSSGA